MSLWTVVRFLHVTAAILWVGGQLTLGLLVRPVAGRLLDPETRTALITALGGRYGRMASFGLIPILVATGLALVYRYGVEFGGFSRAGYGTTLTIKVVLAFVSFGLAGVHGLIATRTSGAAVRWVAIGGTAVSVLVVFFAVVLAG